MVDYARIGSLRKKTESPMMVLTATITQRMLKIISRRCGLVDPVRVIQPINRRNLYFGISTKKKTDEVNFPD